LTRHRTAHDARVQLTIGVLSVIYAVGFLGACAVLSRRG